VVLDSLLANFHRRPVSCVFYTYTSCATVQSPAGFVLISPPFPATFLERRIPSPSTHRVSDSTPSHPPCVNQILPCYEDDEKQSIVYYKLTRLEFSTRIQTN